MFCLIYLDNAATTKVSDEVLDAMMPYLLEEYGNPNSIHIEGRKARKAIEDARHKIADTINAKPEQIVFTSGATEADNMAILSGVRSLDPVRNPHRLCTLVTPIEHKAILEFAKELKADYPAIYTHGTDTLELLFLLRTRSSIGFLSTMYINNETGYAFDIPKIGELCSELGIRFHSDCAQAYGKVDIDVERDHLDFISVSGHKIHAPKGIGFLYARDPEIIKPILFGGGQEFGYRSGTENVAGIVGLGVAAEMACRNYEAKAARMRKLTNYLLDELKSRTDGFRVNGKPHDASGIVNLHFENIDGETLVLFLNAKGIMVSAGSACNSSEAVPSHVLKALGMSDDDARSSIRISFSKYNTEEEVIIAAREIANAVNVLRSEV